MMKNIDEQNQKVLQVRLFDHLKVTGMGGELDEDIIRSEMITKLLVYFFCNHKKSISIQELSDILWPDEGSDNPAGALKNLTYRLRNVMKKQWGDHEFIITGRGSYTWNEEVDLIIDSEEFEENCKKAASQKEYEREMAYLRKAVDLYKGLFLPKFISEYWITSLSTYYHSLYLKTVKKLAGYLETEFKFDEMEQLCYDAIRIEPLDEEFHCFFIKALIGKNDIKLAQEQYKKAEHLLYENLGIRPSDELREVYEELLKQTHEQELDIVAIQKNLKDDLEEGAFLCEFGVFKKIYYLETRRADRLGMSMYISLITVVVTAKFKKGSPEYLELVNTAMGRLQQTLLYSLRSSDVISRYSGTQFIILLPTCQYESAKMVVERIEKMFYSNNKGLKVRLQYGLDEMFT